eukprot:2732310-Pyramimonas_sp.AAC.1
MHEKRATLWAPKAHRLVLAGVRPESLGETPAEPRGPEQIASALTSHWKPIFGAEAVRGEALQECLDK